MKSLPGISTRVEFLEDGRIITRPSNLSSQLNDVFATTIGTFPDSEVLAAG